MKILHINYADDGDETAVAVRRLHCAMLRLGADSTLLVLKRRGNVPATRQAFSVNQRLRIREYQLIEQTAQALYGKMGGSLNKFTTGLAKIANKFNPDVVQLHSIDHAMCSVKELGWLNSPTVWTLHNSWPYCDDRFWHASDDQRFKRGDYPGQKLNGKLFHRKYIAWRNMRFTLVGPSRWIAGEAKSSLLFQDRRCFQIPNGIDLEIFHPIAKSSAKKAFGIAPGKLVVAVSSLHNPYVTEALRIMRKKFAGHLVTLVLGRGVRNLPFHTVYTGALHDDRALAAAYCAADLFLDGAMFGNLPNRLIEAAACGVPAAAFNVGGHADAVMDGWSGLLATPGSAEELAAAAIEILASGDPYGDAACEHAASSFADLTVARRYLDVYQSL